MKTFQVEGIILKRQNVGEADRLLTLFTREMGKMTVKAVGVRKIASKRSSHVEICTLSRCSLYKTQGMPLLTEVEAITSFAGVKNHLARIACAYHVCELIEGLCPENQALPEVFSLLTRTLHAISSHNAFAEIVKSFEVELLSLLGYYSPEEKQTHSTAYLIEHILERKLKTRSMLPQLFAQIQ